MKLKHLNNKKEVQVSDKIWNEDYVEDLVVHAIYVYNNNQRKGTAKTKTRSEVSGGGRKPWAQKGTGRARHGSIRSPIWVGGGISHGPTGEQNWKKDLNKKMRKKAIRCLISKMAKNKKVLVYKFEDEDEIRDIRNKNLETFDREKKSLIVTDKKDEMLAFRNVPYIRVINTENINIYEFANCHKVFIEEEVVDKLEKLLSNE